GHLCRTVLLRPAARGRGDDPRVLAAAAAQQGPGVRRRPGDRRQRQLRPPQLPAQLRTVAAGQRPRPRRRTGAAGRGGLRRMRAGAARTPEPVLERAPSRGAGTAGVAAAVGGGGGGGRTLHWALSPTARR